MNAVETELSPLVHGEPFEQAPQQPRGESEAGVRVYFALLYIFGILSNWRLSNFRTGWVSTMFQAFRFLAFMLTLSFCVRSALYLTIFPKYSISLASSSAALGWDQYACTGSGNYSPFRTVAWFGMAGGFILAAFASLRGAYRLAKSGLLQEVCNRLEPGNAGFVCWVHIALVCLFPLITLLPPLIVVLWSATKWTLVGVLAVLVSFGVGGLCAVAIAFILDMFLFPIHLFATELGQLSVRVNSFLDDTMPEPAKLEREVVVYHSKIMDDVTTASTIMLWPTTVGVAGLFVIIVCSIWVTYLTAYLVNVLPLLYCAIVGFSMLFFVTYLPTANVKVFRAVTLARASVAKAPMNTDEDIRRMTAAFDSVLLYLMARSPYWQFWINIDTNIAATIGTLLLSGASLAFPFVLHYFEPCMTFLD